MPLCCLCDNLGVDHICHIRDIIYLVYKRLDLASLSLDVCLCASVSMCECLCEFVSKVVIMIHNAEGLCVCALRCRDQWGQGSGFWSSFLFG